ncbi:MAG: hypothetical protein JJ934_03195 [Pseudomonadales bacterium]|nr:hypothetical protein [Pseudomonadales bacterium]
MSFSDHAYLQLTDNSLFCIAGDRHPDGYVFGMPYYMPTEDLARSYPDKKVDVSFEHNGNAVTKIRSVLSSDEMAQLFESRWGKNRFASSFSSGLLMKLPRSNVSHQLDGKSALTQIVHELGPDQPLRKLYAAMRAFDPYLLERTALTGSRLLSESYLPSDRDVDMVVGCAPQSFDKLLIHMVQSGLCNLYPETRFESAKSYWRRDLFSIDDTKFDISFSRYNEDCVYYNFEESLETKPYDSASDLEVVITNSNHSSHLPALIKVDGAVDEILFVARGWTSAFFAGDRISLSSCRVVARNDHTRTAICLDPPGHGVRLLDRSPAERRFWQTSEPSDAAQT